MSILSSATEFDDAMAELAEMFPHVDIDAVLALDLDDQISAADVADALIAVGCDPEAVNRLVLDD